jgi:hypothetical protein
VNLKPIALSASLSALLGTSALQAQQQPPPPPYPYAPNPYPYPYPYPDPNQYPYAYPPYAYPAPYQPPPKPRYPQDSAVRTGPFVDLLAGGVALEQRFVHFLTLGISAGIYFGGLIRVAPQISIFSSGPHDNGDGDLPIDFNATQSDSPIILWGGSVGITVISRQTSAFAPGILFLRTDKGAYGSFVGLDFPFDWVTDSGLRIGFSIAVGRSFGGSQRAECINAAGNSPCDPGEVREFDRPAGAGFYSDFHFGWGANHPAPIPTDR